jgi:adenylate kinase
MQTVTPESTPKSAAPVDLEIKDAQLIFNHVWKQLEADHGRENLRFPKELILLGGAPGAGKGTNADFIRELRGITAEPIVVSALLDSPEAQKLKSQGGMVGDREVVGILIRKLLEPEQQNGAILDGFPRTKVQLECLKLLFDKWPLVKNSVDLNVPAKFLFDFLNLGFHAVGDSNSVTILSLGDLDTE